MAIRGLTVQQRGAAKAAAAQSRRRDEEREEARGADRRDNAKAAAGEFFLASKAYLARVAEQDAARKRLAEATKGANEAHAVMAASFAVYEGQVIGAG